MWLVGEAGGGAHGTADHWTSTDGESRRRRWTSNGALETAPPDKRSVSEARDVTKTHVGTVQHESTAVRPHRAKGRPVVQGTAQRTPSPAYELSSLFDRTVQGPDHERTTVENLM